MHLKAFYFLFFSLSIALSKPVKHVKYTSNSDFVITVITNGSYNLEIKGKTWLTSWDTFLQANGKLYTNKNRTLILNQTSATSGEDNLGRWQSTTFFYALFDDPRTTMEDSIITYTDFPIVRFRQRFINGVNNPTVNSNAVSSSFPSFVVDDIVNETVGYLSYGGFMCGDPGKKFGSWNKYTNNLNDGMEGGPLILFNENGDTLVLSPMSNFMSASMQHIHDKDNSVNFGIMGGAESINSNYSVDFIVYYGNAGINKAMEGWGVVLRTFYRKSESYRMNDFNINYLSYWTDNGAYYYYLTEPQKNYQDTVFDIVDDFNTSNIPFRSFQFDSWWYDPHGGGCVKWDTDENVFPNGIQYVYNKIKLPSTAHNRWWDEHVVYAKENGGSYNFVIEHESHKALPNDQQFWDDLLYNASKWGLLTYEQDWQNVQTLSFGPLMTDVNLGRNWLIQMGNAAAKLNISIQYCMSLSRHVLQSVEIPAVTQVRASTDYAENWSGNQNWRIGITSILASAVGLAPFKDVFWSSHIETGNPYGPKAIEPYPELEVAIATLSTGPVGPGDKIGLANGTIIMRCCRNDGLILKPSKAATAIDSQIYASAFSDASKFGDIWSTYSLIQGGYVFGIVLGFDILSTFSLTPQNCGFDVASNSVYWKFGDNKNIRPFTSIELDKSCTMNDYCLYYVSPVFRVRDNDVVFLGEKDKWVPVSAQRVTLIYVDSNGLMVFVSGAIGEKAVFSVAINNNVTDVTCDFSKGYARKIYYFGSDVECN